MSRYLYQILVCLFVFIPCLAKAQLNNYGLYHTPYFNEADSNSWGISVDNFNYMRNTEYFNNIESGRTLFGYQLTPSLFIQPTQHIKVQAGVFLRHDFGGNNPYTQTLPTFSLSIQNKGYNITFGTLSGALSHRIIEPMFDIASAIEKRIENGFDIRYTNPDQRKNPSLQPEKISFYNAWLNWEKFIERQSPHQEKFTAGIHLAPAHWSKYTKVYPVFQAMATHQGGQIDADTSPMTMQVNSTLGLRLPITINTNHSSSIDAYYLTYTETTNSGLFPYRNGNALYANIQHRIGKHTSNEGFTVMLSYFDGNKYMAPRGTAIYQSVSIDKAGVTEANRQLAILRLMYKKQLSDDLILDARIEPVYDIKNSSLDYAYSLYLVYRFNKAFAF